MWWQSSTELLLPLYVKLYCPRTATQMFNQAQGSFLMTPPIDFLWFIHFCSRFIFPKDRKDTPLTGFCPTDNETWPSTVAHSVQK